MHDVVRAIEARLDGHRSRVAERENATAAARAAIAEHSAKIAELDRQLVNDRLLIAELELVLREAGTAPVATTSRRGRRKDEEKHKEFRAEKAGRVTLLQMVLEQTRTAGGVALTTQKIAADVGDGTINPNRVKWALGQLKSLGLVIAVASGDDWLWSAVADGTLATFQIKAVSDTSPIVENEALRHHLANVIAAADGHGLVRAAALRSAMDLDPTAYPARATPIIRELVKDGQVRDMDDRLIIGEAAAAAQ